MRLRMQPVILRVTVRYAAHVMQRQQTDSTSSCDDGEATQSQDKSHVVPYANPDTLGQNCPYQSRNRC